MTVGSVSTGPNTAGVGPDAASTAADAPATTVERFLKVRRLTDLLASRLSPEDQIPQSMTAASPAAWEHLGLTAPRDAATFAGAASGGGRLTPSTGQDALPIGHDA